MDNSLRRRKTMVMSSISPGCWSQYLQLRYLRETYPHERSLRLGKIKDLASMVVLKKPLVSPYFLQS
jgi:hypothetical protein